jgi:hypothetical protein
MKKQLFILCTIATALAGCGSTNSYLANRSSTVEMYHVFDVKTNASTAVVIKAAADGLSQNTNGIQQMTPLQIGQTVPEQPGRFTLTDLGASLGPMMQMAAMQNGGMSLKAAKCDGAVWTSRAQRTISGSSNLNLYSCLYKYKNGYHLDTYAVFNKVEGGLAQVSRDIATSLVGTPEQWVNKTILDTVRSIEKASGAKVVRLEGQPELSDMPNGVLVNNM